MEDLQKVNNVCTCMVRSRVEGHLFGSMKEDESVIVLTH